MKLPEKLRPYEFRIVISLAALVIGILLLTIGFWRTLLLVIVTAIGFVIGSYKDGTVQQLFLRVQSLFGRR